MEKGGDVKGVFDRLARGIQAGGQILTRLFRQCFGSTKFCLPWSVFLAPTPGKIKSKPAKKLFAFIVLVLNVN